jgi:hypothetical protein
VGTFKEFQCQDTIGLQFLLESIATVFAGHVTVFADQGGVFVGQQ